MHARPLECEGECVRERDRERGRDGARDECCGVKTIRCCGKRAEKEKPSESCARGKGLRNQRQTIF